MRVIPPLEITEARLTSSTAAEPGVGEAAFNIATTYALGDQVIVGSPSATVTITIASPGVVTWAAHGMADATPVVLTTSGALPTGLAVSTIYYVVRSTANAFQLSATEDGAPIATTGSQSGTHTATGQVHRLYQSLQASNLGKAPALTSSAAWWQDIGPTNRWAMLDLFRSTATQQASPLTVVLTPGRRTDALALVGLVADSVTVSITSGGSPVYSSTTELRSRTVSTWREYFFEAFATKPSLALFDLPPFTNGIITVTITRSSGLVSCGGLVLGNQVYLGEIQYSAQSEALNFSRIDRDVFGEASLVRRRSVPKTNQTVWAGKGSVNNLREARALLNAVPALWSGLDDTDSPYFEAVLILGIYKQWTIGLDHPDHAVQSLELEEI